MIEGIVFRYRAGIAWRDLPERFGPWQTVWKRHHRFSLDGTWDEVLAILQAEADAAGKLDWRVSVDSSTSRVHQHGATARRSSGGPSSYIGGGVESQEAPPSARPSMGPLARLGPWSPDQRRRDEPDDHAIGRSRGGLTTKTHAIVDGRGRPLVIAVTPGQASDSRQLVPLLAELSLDRLGPGRPRITPVALRADKAYSSRAHRELLRRRGITAVIPEPADQKRNRARRGSRGGRPVNFDGRDDKARNLVEHGFNRIKNRHGLATRYDKHALVFRGGLVLRAILLWLQPT